MAVIQSTQKKGITKLVAKSDGYKETAILIEAVKEKTFQIIAVPIIEIMNYIINQYPGGIHAK